MLGQIWGQKYPIRNFIQQPQLLTNSSGGESGIRTRDTVSRIHTFQACAFNHSATSPQKPAILRATLDHPHERRRRGERQVHAATSWPPPRCFASGKRSLALLFRKCLKICKNWPEARIILRTTEGKVVGTILAGGRAERLGGHSKANLGLAGEPLFAPSGRPIAAAMRRSGAQHQRFRRCGPAVADRAGLERRTALPAGRRARQPRSGRRSCACSGRRHASMRYGRYRCAGIYGKP